jgi:hypothetical protein
VQRRRSFVINHLQAILPGSHSVAPWETGVLVRRLLLPEVSTARDAATGGTTRTNPHGGELCIISSHRICEEPMGTALLGASSTEMMQDFPLHVQEGGQAMQVKTKVRAGWNPEGHGPKG